MNNLRHFSEVMYLGIRYGSDRIAVSWSFKVEFRSGNGVTSSDHIINWW